MAGILGVIVAADDGPGVAALHSLGNLVYLAFGTEGTVPKCHRALAHTIRLQTSHDMCFAVHVHGPYGSEDSKRDRHKKPCQDIPQYDIPLGGQGYS